MKMPQDQSRGRNGIPLCNNVLLSQMLYTTTVKTFTTHKFVWTFHCVTTVSASDRNDNTLCKVHQLHPGYLDCYSTSLTDVLAVVRGRVTRGRSHYREWSRGGVITGSGQGVGSSEGVVKGWGH